MNCFIEYSSDISANLGIFVAVFSSALFLTVAEGSMYDHPRIIQGAIQTFLMLFFLTTGAKPGTSDFEFSS